MRTTRQSHLGTLLLLGGLGTLLTLVEHQHLTVLTRTSNGKEAAARNAYRGGVRPMLRAIAASLKEQRRALDSL